jgi:diadenosine tetraphosphatase ApaH/serine/threonine PP2A family protein phosphatase
MRLALLADIHANREAFAACLADARQHGFDRLIFLGDYVGYGADPGWAVDAVRAEVARGAAALLGNHDMAAWSVAEADAMNDAARTAIEWTRTQLDASQLAFLRSLPATMQDGGRLFVHANPIAPLGWDYVLDVRDAEQCLRLSPCEQTFCAHVHVPALYWLPTDRPVGASIPQAGADILLLRDRRWLAVLGAVGQPRDGKAAACYAVLDVAEDTLTYRRVPYDVATAARKIRAAGLPLMLSERLALGY